jgi:hypothetical protein
MIWSWNTKQDSKLKPPSPAALSFFASAPGTAQRAGFQEYDLDLTQKSF